MVQIMGWKINNWIILDQQKKIRVRVRIVELIGRVGGSSESNPLPSHQKQPVVVVQPSDMKAS